MAEHLDDRLCVVEMPGEVDRSLRKRVLVPGQDGLTHDTPLVSHSVLALGGTVSSSNGGRRRPCAAENPESANGARRGTLQGSSKREPVHAPRVRPTRISCR